MNEQNDKNLREALRRREAKRPKRQVPADFCDKVMAEVQPRRRRWPRLAAVASVAAAVVVAALLLWPKAEPAPALVAETGIVAPAVAKQPAATHVPVAADLQVSNPAPRKQRRKPAKEIPDTLGAGIWQSERNVLMALQVLSECEAVIEKEELAVRNALVETSYNTLPQPGTQLVVCENGDYQIVASNEQNIIEI
jgi:hypothetical protein